MSAPAGIVAGALRFGSIASRGGLGTWSGRTGKGSLMARCGFDESFAHHAAQG